MRQDLVARSARKEVERRDARINLSVNPLSRFGRLGTMSPELVEGSNGSESHSGNSSVETARKRSTRVFVVPSIRMF